MRLNDKDNQQASTQKPSSITNFTCVLNKGKISSNAEQDHDPWFKSWDRRSFTNMFALDNLQKNRKKRHKIHNNCNIYQELHSNDDNIFSETEYAIQCKVRKVASICNIFNKSNSEPILSGDSNKSKHLALFKNSNSEFRDYYIDCDGAWNEKTDLTFLTSSEREDLRMSLNLSTGITNDKTSDEIGKKDRRLVMSDENILGNLIKEEKIGPSMKNFIFNVLSLSFRQGGLFP